MSGNDSTLLMGLFFWRRGAELEMRVKEMGQGKEDENIKLGQ